MTVNQFRDVVMSTNLREGQKVYVFQEFVKFC